MVKYDKIGNNVVQKKHARVSVAVMYYLVHDVNVT